MVSAGLAGPPPAKIQGNFRFMKRIFPIFAATNTKNLRTEKKYMQRCLDLAVNGLGLTYPNPLVGCVIVHRGRIIGEGWHQKAGEAHAEVHAINSVKDRSLLPESALYVNLEPCSPYRKIHTPV